MNTAVKRPGVYSSGKIQKITKQVKKEKIHERVLPSRGGPGLRVDMKNK
jgi:hypothetical protein